MKKQDKLETKKQSRPTEALADLEMTDEQAEEAKAGASPALLLHCATGSH